MTTPTLPNGFHYAGRAKGLPTPAILVDQLVSASSQPQDEFQKSPAPLPSGFDFGRYAEGPRTASSLVEQLLGHLSPKPPDELHSKEELAVVADSLVECAKSYADERSAAGQCLAKKLLLKSDLQEHQQLLTESGTKVTEMRTKAGSASDDLASTDNSDLGKALKQDGGTLEDLHGKVKEKREKNLTSSKSIEEQEAKLILQLARQGARQGLLPEERERLIQALRTFERSRREQQQVTSRVEKSTFGTWRSETVLEEVLDGTGAVAKDRAESAEKKGKAVGAAAQALNDDLYKLEGIIADSEYHINSALTHQNMAIDHAQKFDDCMVFRLHVHSSRRVFKRN